MSHMIASFLLHADRKGIDYPAFTHCFLSWQLHASVFVPCLSVRWATVDVESSPSYPGSDVRKERKGQSYSFDVGMLERRKQSSLAAREMLPLDHEQKGHGKSFTNKSEISLRLHD